MCSVTMSASESDIQSLEFSILCGECPSQIEGGNSLLDETVKDFCCGQYGIILKSDFATTILNNSANNNSETLDSVLHRNVAKFFEDGSDEDSNLRELKLLLVAVSCLQLFVQNNWIGPCPSSTTPKHILPEYMYTETEKKRLMDMLETELSVDGEPIYNLAIFPEFLYIARCILVDCRERLQHLQTADWWLLRCINIQQQILDDKSNTLRETIIQLIDTIEKSEPLMTDDKNRNLQIMFHLEAGHLSHVYFRYKEAKEHFRTAKKLSGLNVQLTGAMGKRTKFQQNDLAQLMLQVTREDEASTNGCTDLQMSDKTAVLPKNLDLDDDTVLEAVSFSEDMKPAAAVSETEQAMILGLMEDYRRSRASADFLTDEEVHAYIDFILSHVQSWSVSVSALLLRSRLQRNNRRRVERSMRQLEELYNQTKREEPSAGQRLRLFYAVKIIPVWEVHSQLADILLSLGALGSALQIYEQLQLWELAISCYQRLGKTEKAETVIREQLAIKETPNLWCFLGDITKKIEHYEKGWELSKHRSARAQRCLGYLYFAKEDYEKCLECFAKSLKVNALQVPVWFTYGCAAMAAKEWKLAVANFKRCVSIDYDNFEGWNNLASAYVKLKDKKKAFMTLSDAIKCNYENWRIWENYLIVSTDCGEFGEVIRAFHRLFDLRDKYVDEEILSILVLSITENLDDANGRPSKHLEPKLRELFGRITSKVANNAKVWSLYAQLSKDNMEMALQYLQKSHRCVMQTANWEKDLEKCKQITQESLQLSDNYIQCCSSATNATQALQMLSSAKLMLRGVLSKIKQQHTDPITQELSSEVKDMCSSLDDGMTTVVEKIEELKRS